MTQLLRSEKEWYYVITKDWNTLPQFIEYFSNEADSAKTDLAIKGKLEDHNRTLPVIIESRFTQLQILNAVLEYFDIELRKEKSSLYRKYLEGYQRQLSSRDIEAYIIGEPSMVGLNLIINEISLVRNRFLGIIKSLESKSFSLNNIVKLRTAGLEDSRMEG